MRILSFLTIGGAGAAVAAPLSPGVVWDLTPLYADEAAWEAEFAAWSVDLPGLTGYSGRLGEGAGVLLEALRTSTALQMRLGRLSVYASLQADEDTRVAVAQGRKQRVSVAWSRLGEAAAYLSPEIQALGAERVRAHLDSEPGLAPWRFPLEEILRNAPHTLSSEAESILSGAGFLAAQPYEAYSMLTNADIPWPTVELVDGTQVTVDQAAYVRLRADLDRENRQRVFAAFWGAWKTYERTLGTLLNAKVQGNILTARQRRYPNVLSWALASDNVPEAVYRTLVAETRKALPNLHRTFRLRERLLGISESRYHDLYPPVLLPNGLPSYDLELSRELSVASLAPLGADYVKRFEAAARGRWMHSHPQPGKRSGAYMSGAAYEVHPYVLLNHQDDFDGLTTYAHEWGHAMHTLLANEAQPYPTARYSIFTAEVASILHELLLNDHLVRTARSDKERLYFLGEGLEMMRATFFRQVMFAEYELQIHELAEQGEALTGERLSSLYRSLLEDYHGHAEGVVRIDDAVTLEWAYIPHFYYEFYVYQYATSLAAAAYFAEQLAAGEAGASERFLEVLRAGGSDHPYEILRRAGLDLASPEPYQALARRHARILDAIEATLARE